MPSKPSKPPPPLPITNAHTDSPLFQLPPELRTKIWELILNYNGCIEVPVDGHRDPRAAKEERLKAIPPPITRSCRLVRSETLPMFFGLNDFLFVTNYITPTGTFEEWLYTMRPHLSSMNYIFVLSSWIEVSLMSGTCSHRDIIARLYHDKHRNCWAVTSLDDWDDYDDHLRWDLECDSDLLQDILRQMTDQRSRADITPEFMLWLIFDLMRIYYHAKILSFYPGQRGCESRASNWFRDLAEGPPPYVARPPNMYTTDLDEEFLRREGEWEDNRDWDNFYTGLLVPGPRTPLSALWS